MTTIFPGIDSWAGGENPLSDIPDTPVPGRPVENSEHPLAWCFYCKTWQPEERLHRVDVAVGWAPSMHGALRKAAGVPIVPTQPLTECSHHLDQYGDHAAARPRVTRYAGGNAWCVYSLTPDELAALREVDWL